MTINERILTALLPFGDPVVPDLYEGEARRYYTFNYDVIPVLFADDEPCEFKVLVQVHLFAPPEDDVIERISHTVFALAEAGFTWPEIGNATDTGRQGDTDPSQHYVFECETADWGA